MAGTFAQLLEAGRVLILDGAMGTELQRRGADTALPLWSARALVDNPNLVLEIHRAYIEAGADIVTTNTFRTTRRTFRRAGLPDRSEELVKRAVELARQAQETFPERRVLVAGSIAPLEDCYRPDLVPGDTELEGEHGELASRLAAAGVDVLLLETMNTTREAAAACRAASATGKDVCVSFLCTVQADLYDGSQIPEVVRSLIPLRPTAFSVNCVSARSIVNAVRQVRAATSLPIGVYANVGLPEQEQGWEFTHDVSDGEYATYASSWVAAGAQIIGGCCGTTPHTIETLCRALRRQAPAVNH
jgi:S-methylmethionine-dependent homocysteine/selenocysteine methylase